MSSALAVLAGLTIGIQTAGAEDTKPPIVVALVGDSTVTDKAGWGKAFANCFGDGVKVFNFAVGGRSSKSWYNEKRLPAVLNTRPDYALIQFGHNDQPGKGPARETDPATTYRDYLKLYVREFRKIGSEPIFVSGVLDDRRFRSGRHTRDGLRRGGVGVHRGLQEQPG